jgi:hypothetical protein
MKSFKKWYIPIISVSAVIFLLIFFLIILAFRPERKLQSISGPSGKKLSESDKIPDKNKEPEKITKEISSFSAQAKLLNAPWIRDPFSLDSLKTRSVETVIAPRHGSRTTSGRLLDLNLTGIVFFDNHYMALINDAGIREGDTILGFKVLKIKRDYIVLLDSSGDYYTLDLK